MTNESTSLLSLGDLTKPATILIEKISNAVGKIYEPRHIIKIAKAQATARIIEVENNIEIAELKQRALQRFLAEETRKQSNIESITTKALEFFDYVLKDWIKRGYVVCSDYPISSTNDLSQL
ncbi:MAG: hypothetical protein ACRC8K_09685 [Waterburya sp.]